MYFLGDAHGQFGWWKKVISRDYCKSSIQLGDFGIGFLEREDTTRNYVERNGEKRSYHPDGVDPEKHKFIRGNHDDPAICRESPHYLGDYGFIEKLNLFYISGALSIDKDPIFGGKYLCNCDKSPEVIDYFNEKMSMCRSCPELESCDKRSILWEGRTQGLDWWEDEELSYNELENMVILFKETKPRIVVSHTCPLEIITYFTEDKRKRGGFDRSSNFFSEAWTAHKPEWWLFGHFHRTNHAYIQGTDFRCVGANQTYEIKGIDF